MGEGASRLLFVVVIAATTAAGGRALQLLPLDTARPAALERRRQAEVNVLLRVQTHHERRHVHDLLTDPAGREMSG